MAYSLKKTLASCAAAIGVVALTGAAQAQIGNSGSGFGGQDSQIGGASGFVVHEQSVQSATGGGVPANGLSRLPLTTAAQTPVHGNLSPQSIGGESGSSKDAKVGKQAFGTSTQEWPYSHQRVAVLGTPFPTTTASLVPVTSRPFRWAGKLWMRFGNSWFVCSAALIKRGLLVTAAHCVHNYGNGANGWADEVRFYPANHNANGGLWGYFRARSYVIPTVYYNGTDTCTTVGVVCNNDIAIVLLLPRQTRTGADRYAGQILGGWFGYGWNGYSYPRTSVGFGGHTIAEINQLGYPAALDYGRQMQRNNSFGKYVTATGTNGQQLRNTQLGSPMTGGSSGGPWIVNFGTNPFVNGNASLGIQAARNIIVGVTSWGYVDPNINVQGASWFGQNNEFPNADYGGRGAGNIGALVNATCNAFAAYC